MNKIKNGTIYDTKYSGKIEVIDDLGLIDNVHKLKIKFLDTGYEDIVKLRDITSKLVSDPNNYNNPTIYESNGYGKFKIIRDLGTDKHGFRKVEIEFLTTLIALEAMSLAAEVDLLVSFCIPRAKPLAT